MMNKSVSAFVIINLIGEKISEDCDHETLDKLKDNIMLYAPG